MMEIRARWLMVISMAYYKSWDNEINWQLLPMLIEKVLRNIQEPHVSCCWVHIMTPTEDANLVTSWNAVVIIQLKTRNINSSQGYDGSRLPS